MRRCSLPAAYTDPIDVNIKDNGGARHGHARDEQQLRSTRWPAMPRSEPRWWRTRPPRTTRRRWAPADRYPAADPIGGSASLRGDPGARQGVGPLWQTTFPNDGTFTFGGGFSYTYDPANRAVAGKIDYIGVAMHEFSEIMGRIGLMGQNVFGQADYMQHDLFHYTGAGVRGLNNGAGRSSPLTTGQRSSRLTITPP